MSKKVIRKRWIRIFGKYDFEGIVELAKTLGIDPITAFKPSLCVDVHFKGKADFAK